MIPYLRRALVSRLRSGRALFALTLLGVALGVASVLSIEILSQNALAAFQGSVRAVSGDADLSVLGRGPWLSEALYPRLLATAGVEAAWPVLRVDASLAGRRDFYLEIVGLDPFASPRLPWREPPSAPGDPFRVPGWVAVSPALARELGVARGDSIAVTSGSRQVALFVGAIVDYRRVSPLASRRLVVMDISQAQSLFGNEGRLSQIDVRLARGARRGDVARALGIRLGPSVQVVTPEQRQRQAQGLLEAFRLNLRALSLVSLFVGGFLVYSSTTASLVRRRTELGLLRTLGASRSQILALILGEVAALGAAGLVLGIPLGYWVARSNVHAVSATLSNLYLLEEIESLRLTPGMIVTAIGVGLAGALGGALLPALETTRRETRELLAPFRLHERVGRAAGRLALLGSALLAVAALWYAVFGRPWRASGFVLGVCLLAALPLFVPLLVQRVFGHLRVRKLGLAYGAKTLAARLQTAAVSVAALAVAASMLFGITLLVGSFRRTVQLWVDDTARADVYVSGQSFTRGRSQATLDSALVSALTHHPGVRAADRLRQLSVIIGGRRVALSGLALGLPGGERRFSLRAGDRHQAWARMRRERAILVGEPLARKAGLSVGDRLSVYGEHGRVELPIAGIYYDYTTESGSAVMELAAMQSVFGPGPITNLALYLEPGRDPERIAGELRAELRGAPLRIRSNRALRQEILSIFDQTFAVTRLVQVMSLLIAVCGVALALLVSARERAAELALYRALGATRPQVFRIFVGQGVGMGAAALIVGAFGGLALASLLIFLINPAYFGWTIAIHWPAGALAGQTATILAATILASLYPALAASRVPATELSREDL